MLPLRILHVAAYADRAWAYGGIPRVLAGLAGAQAQAGHRVIVAATDACDATSRLQPAAAPRPRGLAPWTETPASGVEYRIFPNVSNTLAYRWQFYQPVGLARFLREQAAEVDVAHLHACHNLPVATSARILFDAGVPYVVQPNGTGGRIEQRRLAKAAFDALFGRRFLARAAAVIAVSEWERAQLERAGVAATRIHVVPNPLAPPPAPAGAGSFRARLGLAGAPLVLFLGALSRRKNAANVARAVAKLDAPAQLVFAGNDRGAAGSTRGVVRELGVGDRTRFTGLLSGDDRFAALADADVVVYASSDEAFGLVPLEALQVGTPVIVGNDAGCGELIAELGGGIVVPPGDVATLTAALREVLRDLPRWRDAARSAGQAASERFHPHVVWQRLEAAYRAVIASEPA